MKKLTDEQITEKVMAAVNEYKKAAMSSKADIYKQDGKLNCTVFGDVHEVSVSMYERIRVHSEHGVFPELLFLNKSPRIQADEFDYLKDNFKGVTLPIFIDFLNTLKRCFYEDSMEFQKEDDTLVKNKQTLKDYLDMLPKYGNFSTYIKDLFPKFKTIDAMGLVVIRPRDVQFDTAEDGITRTIANTEMFEPLPYNILSKNIIAFEEDEWYLVLSEEKSEVRYKTKLENKGMIFEYYDKETIKRVVQFGNFVDYTFNLEEFLPHNLGYVPARRCKGIPCIYGDNLVWQSPYLYAVDILDLVLLNATNLMLSIYNCAYPIKIMYGDLCEAPYTDANSTSTICQNGQVFDTVKQANIQCPSCHGSGMKTRLSPTGLLLLKPRSSMSPNDAGFENAKPVEYVSPDPSIMDWLNKKIHEDELRAKRVLHLHTSSSEVQGKENLLATDMMLDNKAMYAFIRPQSDQIHDMTFFCVDTIGKMRYGTKFVQPKYKKPVSFDLMTESEYLIRISEATKAGAPNFIIYAMMVQYLKSFYSTDTQSAKVTELIIVVDRLLTHTPEDIIVKKNRNLVADWEIYLHDSPVTLTNMIIKELGGIEKFLSTPISELAEKMMQLAKSQMELITAEIPVEVEAEPFISGN
jgi:hypothetical protein